MSEKHKKSIDFSTNPRTRAYAMMEDALDLLGQAGDELAAAQLDHAITLLNLRSAERIAQLVNNTVI
jgi:hypothetical protein